MKVKQDWWRGFFNDVYLITDARSVCSPSLTRREVDLLEDTLGLDKSDEILDLCGGHGRHSLELAKRGYQHLTVLDLSDYLVRMGRKAAKKAGLKVKFIHSDARVSGLKAASFTAIFIMANSFGYFQDEKKNLSVLRESHRLLKERGRLLLDLTDAGYLKDNLKPLSWHEANRDIVVCRERELKKDIIKAREIVISKKDGLLRDGRYAERVYSKNKITRLLKKSGFNNLSIKDKTSLHKNKGDYGLLNSRMIVTGVKG